MLKTNYRNLNFWIILIADIIIIGVSLFFSFGLRFDLHIPGVYSDMFIRSLPFFIIIKIFSFLIFHLYRGMWRYSSLFDMYKILIASMFSSAVIIALFSSSRLGTGFPRSVYIIDFVLTTGLIGGLRIVIRIFLTRHNGNKVFLRKDANTELTRLILIGAGDSGEKILREIRSSEHIHYKVIGLLDDNPRKRDAMIHGVPVLGNTDDLLGMHDRYDEILICIPTATNQQMRSIIEKCQATHKKYRTLPGIYELIDGKVNVSHVREVSIEDLLGRDEVTLNRDSISQMLNGKSIMITGAGGSIGSELVRQCIPFEPSLIILLDYSEFNLFSITQEISRIHSGIHFIPYLCDIRKRDALDLIVRRYKPQIILHAAAYKHVPIQENHPWESVFTNILGTANLIHCAKKHDVEKFVLVSTDKAVRPVNVMGMTKRIAEILIQQTNGIKSAQFLAVRFGNVLGSSGSVIPIFKEQIRRGGPVSITHPDMERFFMSIPEAVQLILQAATIGRGSEIFVLDMGNPIKIDQLARDLIRLSGFEPGVDIQIEYTGLRPGEKISEELITNGESVKNTDYRKIMVLNSHGNGKVSIASQLEELYRIANSFDSEKIRNKLSEIIRNHDEI